MTQKPPYILNKRRWFVEAAEWGDFWLGRKHEHCRLGGREWSREVKMPAVRRVFYFDEIKLARRNKKTRLRAGIFTSRDQLPAPQPAVLLLLANPKVPSIGRFHEPPSLSIRWQLRHAMKHIFFANKKQQRHLEHDTHNAVVVSWCNYTSSIIACK